MSYDTPGGEVSGAFDLAEDIRAAAKIKPITAALNDEGLSSGYLLASAASSISITRTGLAGSIGVVMRHIDLSQWLKKEGVAVKMIYAGARKVDGNPYEPLPEAVRERFQAEINAIYGMFAEAVADARGLSTQDVINTEADTFMGSLAVEKGLADRVESPNQLLQRLADNSAGSAFQPQGGNSPQETTKMSTEKPAAETTATTERSGASAAELEQARLDGAQAERERIFAILDHEQAEGRLASAVNLARVEQMTPEGAGKVLEAMPAATAATGSTEFAALMEKFGMTDVGADDADESEPKLIESSWDHAFAQVGR
jgi:ClpP class serine protease